MQQRKVSTSLLSALAAGPHAIFSPVLAFSTRRDGNRPLLTLVGVVFFTALAASASNPVAAHILQTMPDIAASADFARKFVLIQSALFTPIGTTVFLVAMAATVWAISLVSGADVTFRQSASIVFMAGVVVVLKRLFVAVVLYTRWWLRPSSLHNEITTGLDGFIAPDLAASFPFSILKEGGLFEIWFLILVAIGLVYDSQLPRRSAAAIALATGVVLIGSKVTIAALAST